MRSYISLFLFSLIATWLLTPVAKRVAIRLGAVDIPDNKRRIHSQPTPRMGGIAVYLSFLCTLAIVPFLGNELSQRFNSHPQWYAVILVATTLIFFLGIYDDLFGSQAWLKIGVQIIAAALLEYFGLGINVISLPFLGENHVVPQWIGYPLTMCWIVGITNAFNLVDGIDGLAAGTSAFALLSILFTSIANANFEVGLLAVILLGCVIGFLYHNFHPAKIFLGDSGSLTLGFLVATLSLVGAQKGTTTIAIAIPLVSFGLPVVEVFLSLIRRFVGGKPLMQSDRGHIHHRLLDHGLSVRQSAILLYGVCGIFCLFGILLLNPRRSLSSLVFIILGVLIILGVQRLRYPEFQELGQKLRDGVVLSRKRMVANVSVRQKSAEMKRAQSAEIVFLLLNEICEANQFDGMLLELKPQIGELSRAELITASEKNGWTAVRRSDSSVAWGYSTEEISIGEILSSSGYWNLQVPLESNDVEIGSISFYHRMNQVRVIVDLQSICSSLQKELSGVFLNLLEKSRQTVVEGRKS